MLSPQTAVNTRQVPQPAPAPSNPAPATRSGPSFAQVLTDQAPATVTPPPSAAPVPKAPEAAPDSVATTSPIKAGPGENRPPLSKTKAGSAGAPPASGNAPTARKPDAGDKDAKADASDGTQASTDAPDTVDDDKAGPETAGLDEFTSLIALAPSATPALPAADTAAVHGAHAPHAGHQVPADTDPAEAAGADAGKADAATDSRAGRRAGDSGRTAAAEAAQGKAADTAAAAKDAASGHFAAALKDAAAQQPAEAARTAPHVATTELTALAGAAGAAGIAGAPGSPPAAVADGTSSTASLQSHVGSPEFAPELAASVSLLAVDGVQTAELQLNPTDMGPVSVQIVVDGAQAHVSFHAAQAETRQALEQSLPDLAAALRDGGLTLSGGGVFQQSPRERQASSSGTGDRSTSASARGGRGGGEPVSGTTATATRRSVGLLDTFA